MAEQDASDRVLRQSSGEGDGGDGSPLQGPAQFTLEAIQTRHG